MLELGTSYILDNEPCFNLSELNFTYLKGNPHRYRVYIVVRNDKLVKYMEDMGAAIKCDQFRIPGGVKQNGHIYIEHTVQELRDMADKLRVSKGFDKLELVGVDKINE